MKEIRLHSWTAWLCKDFPRLEHNIGQLCRLMRHGQAKLSLETAMESPKVCKDIVYWHVIV